jgi:putative ABC transport system permease protein
VFRRAAATIGSAPWRRAPLLLLRRPAVLISAAGACLVLAASIAAVPLFLSSSGTAALERQAAERCAAASGATLYATAEGSAFAAAAEATSADRAELGPGIVTYLPRITLSVTPAGGGQSWLSQLLARTGAVDHLEPVEQADVGEGGAWVSDRLAANAGIHAGDDIAISSLSAPAVLPVAGVYRDLVSRELDDFWCPLQTSLAAVNPYGDLPPPPVIVDEATFLDLSERMDLGVGDGPPPTQWVRYEAPVTRDLTLEEAIDLTAFYRSWPGLIDAELGAREVPRVGAPVLESDLTFMAARADALRASVGGGIVPVAVAAILAAAGMVAAAAALWADRKHQELSLLVARGIGPGAIGVKAALELSSAIVAGTAAGFVAAYGSIRLFGPSPRLETDAVVRAGLLSLTGAIVAAALVGGVAAARSQARLREHARRRWRLGLVPWELGIVVLAVVSYQRLGRIGVPEVQGASVENVDALALAFPLLFLVAALAVLVRVGLPLLRRRRSGDGGPPRHWAPYLARRRLAAGQAAAITFFAASALSFGVLLYASTLTQSLTSTLDAKVLTFVGTETVVQLAGDAPVPEAIADRTAKIQRLGGTLDGSPVEVIAVDPSTFARAAFWDSTFAGAPLGELLARLPSSEPAPGDSVAAIVIGGSDPSGELEITGGERPRAVEAVGRASLFPGATRGRSVLVVSQAETPAFGDRVASTVEIWSKAGRAEVLDALDGSDAQVVYTRAAEGIFDQTVFLTVTWTFGFMRSLGVVAGVIAIGGLAIYLDARRRSRTLGYAFLRRMGLRPATHRRALLLEIAATVLVGGAAGIVLALTAGWLVHRRLDPVPSIPPGTLLRLPLPLLAAAIAIAVAVCVAGAFLAQRLADRDDPMEVLRAGA